jgi:hypothetical protein
MLWILGSALILAVHRFYDYPGAIPEPLERYWQFHKVADSFLYGIQLAAALVFGTRLIARNGPLPREPGHWLLIKSAGSLVIGWGTGIVWHLIFGGQSMNDHLNWFEYYLLALYIPEACLTLMALILLWREPRWRAFLGWLLLLSGINVGLSAVLLTEQLMEGQLGWGWTLFFQWSNWQLWLQVPTLVGLVGLWIWDYRVHKERDWMHHAGVASEALVILLNVATDFAYSYLLRSP